MAKYISPQSHSDTVEIRSEGTIDDFTGSYAKDKAWGTLNGVANRKGLLISCEILHVVLFNSKFHHLMDFRSLTLIKITLK